MSGGQQKASSVQNEGHGKKTEEEILAASRRLLARGGVEALTIGAIAAEAGVYRAAVHYHFGSKEALLGRVVQMAYHEDTERAALAARDCPPGAERIHFILGRWLEFVNRDEDLLFFDVLGHVLRNPEMNDDLQRLYRRWTTILVELLSEDGPSSNSERLLPLALAARMFIDGAIVERLIHPDGNDWRLAAVAMEAMLGQALAELHE